jgi:hypothetical protein
MTTAKKRDPDDVLAIYGELLCQDGITYDEITDAAYDLAAALRDTLAPYCLGRGTIQRVADEGQIIVAGHAFIAASDLFKKDPYVECDQLRAKLEKAEGELKLARAVVALAKELQSFGLIESLGVRRNSFRVSEELDAAIAAYDQQPTGGAG